MVNRFGFGSVRQQRPLPWRLHQLAGLQFSLFLSFVFLSGSFAVISHEIDWLLRPVMWVKPVAEDKRVSWGVVADAVMRHAPDARITYIYDPLHRASTFDVVVAGADDRIYHVYVHPLTGEVTGEGAWAGVQRFLRDAHRRLMIFQTVGGVRVGILLVCLSSVYLLLTLLTSFWIYKKWWRGFLRWPKGRNLRSFSGDLHRWMGIWSLWFVVIMVHTGLWYLIEEFTGRPALQAQEMPSAAGEITGNLGAATALDVAVNKLLQENPDFDIQMVTWPSQPSEPFQILGDAGRVMLTNPQTNSVWADSTTGTLLSAFNPSTFSLRERVHAANNLLHFGTFAGYVSKLLYFVFGLALTALSLTGVQIYVLRLGLQEKIPVSWRSGIHRAWLSMGWARWPALVLTLSSFFLAPFSLL